MSPERALGLVLFIVVIIFILHLLGVHAAEAGEDRSYHEHHYQGWGHLPWPYRYYRHEHPIRICSYDYYGRPFACHMEYR